MSRVRHVAEVVGGYMRRVASSWRRLIGPNGVREDPREEWAHPDAARIVWFIQTYRDLPRLRTTLARLRALYPESQVLVVSDGDANPEIPDVCGRHAAEFTLRPRLFGVEHGGEPAHLMLEAFLARDADVMIKIDPDTTLRRRFAKLPPAESAGLYGTVQSAGLGPNRLTSIQGGCIIVPRKAAVLLAASSLLLSDRLKPPTLEWAVNDTSRARARSGLTSYDWTLGWACRELDLHSSEHPEVFCRHRPSLVDAITDRGAAIAHPRFEIAQLADEAFYLSGLRAAIRDAIRAATAS